MSADVPPSVLTAAGAKALTRGERIQSLWSGYGEIFRGELWSEGQARPVVVKRVQPPTTTEHPRGWASDRGHARKLRSYEVEQAFYQRFAPRLSARARVAGCLAAERTSDGWWFVFEDLDAAGFPIRPRNLDRAGIDTCLCWLAGFHATFMGAKPEGLWPVGTYWHLDTRPDELAATVDPELVRAAPVLDARLNGCRFPTLVHGDAKLANFCFGVDGAVASVDFQYVGGGPGVKDVAYFLSSLSDETAVAAEADGYLDTYFGALRRALSDTTLDVDAVEDEGRQLYPLAWADFFRFLAGWAPDHWKINDYSRRMTRQALAELI